MQALNDRQETANMNRFIIIIIFLLLKFYELFCIVCPCREHLPTIGLVPFVLPTCPSRLCRYAQTLVGDVACRQ